MLAENMDNVKKFCDREVLIWSAQMDVVKTFQWIENIFGIKKKTLSISKGELVQDINGLRLRQTHKNESMITARAVIFEVLGFRRFQWKLI